MPRTRLPRPTSIALPALVALALAVASACGATEAPPGPTPTSTATEAPATATPGSLTSLRDVDFEDPAVVAELINRAGGGEVHREEVVFDDLTDDGVEEAIVVVHSGGTAGVLGVGVFRLERGHARLEQYIAAPGQVQVRLGLIVTQEGVYDAGDAQCCPSRLREIAYQWDGDSFEAISDQVVPNPSQ